MSEVKRYYVFDTSEDHEAPFIKESDYLTLQAERDDLKFQNRELSQCSLEIMRFNEDQKSVIRSLESELDGLRELQRWIPVDMSKMKDGFICDLWAPTHGRLANYRLVKNYKKSGNHFFEPVSSGVSCVRTATHYMGLPKAPL